MIDKKQAQRAFSRHRGGGELTAEIGRRLAARLDELGVEPAVVVDVGGDGAAMAAYFAKARIVAADFALPRLQTAAARVCRVAADAERLPMATASADVVWANLCYEWTDLKTALGEAARILRPQRGLLIFSTLGRDTLSEARAVFAEDGRVHEFMDMHDIGDMLAGAGFAEPVLETERLVLTYHDAAAALREVHAAGCGCALHTRARGMLGRRRWQAALAEYTRRFADAKGRLPATYEVIYAVAWRRSPPPTEAVVRFAGRRGVR